MIVITTIGNPYEYFNQYKIYHLRDIFTSSQLKILYYACGVGLFSLSIFHAFPDVTIHGLDVSEEIRIGNNFFTDRFDDIALLVTVLHHVVPVSERP